MQKHLRLRKSQEFSMVYRHDQSWASDILVLKVLPSSEKDNKRFGFAVGKRIGHAVTRNHIKRRLREAARHSKVKNGWDMIFIARSGTKDATYHRINDAMRKLLSQANLLT